MNDLTQRFMEFAREKHADLVGVAPIERFSDVAPEHHPASIFPECTSVIVIGKRLTRGTLRGVEEGTQFDLYGQYGVSWLMDRMLAITTISLATWLEDNRYEACPIQDLPPEVPPSGVSVGPGVPAPNVMIDVPEAAVRAGLAEIGYNGEPLTPQFGSRQRFQLILTDAPLDPTPMLAAAVCDRCGACRTSCPVNAFVGEKTIAIAGKEMTVADINMSACKSCKNGARPNPHHAAGKPDRLAAICTRSCVDHLDREKRVQNSLQNPFRNRPAWQIDAQGNRSLQTGV
jgi:epoxyqueuosine reductase QueG